MPVAKLDLSTAELLRPVAKASEPRSERDRPVAKAVLALAKARSPDGKLRSLARQASEIRSKTLEPRSQPERPVANVVLAFAKARSPASKANRRSARPSSWIGKAFFVERVAKRRFRERFRGLASLE